MNVFNILVYNVEENQKIVIGRRKMKEETKEAIIGNIKLALYGADCTRKYADKASIAIFDLFIPYIK